MATLNNYESMIIFTPNLSKEEMDKALERFQNALAGKQAETGKIERLGKRKMAYWVGGQEEGFYCLITFRADGEAVHELERQFRLSDQVLKFQTLKVLPLRVLKVKKPKAPKAPSPAATAAPGAPPVQAS